MTGMDKTSRIWPNHHLSTAPLENMDRKISLAHRDVVWSKEGQRLHRAQHRAVLREY